MLLSGVYITDCMTAEGHRLVILYLSCTWGPACKSILWNISINSPAVIMWSLWTCRKVYWFTPEIVRQSCCPVNRPSEREGHSIRQHCYPLPDTSSKHISTDQQIALITWLLIPSLSNMNEPARLADFLRYSGRWHPWYRPKTGSYIRVRSGSKSCWGSISFQLATKIS